ncbi:MAG: hypothetical protein AAF512_11965, partial [Pseudomonadota bacterium]
WRPGIVDANALRTMILVLEDEVRLPIHNHELAYLELPLNGAGQQPTTSTTDVTLAAEFAGETHQWQGQIVRTEGELDPSTRMVHVVARISDPYDNTKQYAPLAVGLFVDAEIYGKTLDNVAILPREALRGDEQVLVVDDNEQLRFRKVDVLRLADEQVYIGAGLNKDERVCISPLQSTFDGMRVRVAQDAEPATVVSES